MAHALSIRDNGLVEFAYTGEKAWHGLGQEVTADATIDQWMTAAGMDWKVKESPMMAMIDNEIITVEGKKMLYRGDSKAQLSVVGEDYKVVQPGEVLSFFDDLTKLNGMKMDTAGVLYGGRRFWALADTNQRSDIVKGDEVQSKVLLVTSVDGTMSTQARFISTRVVCANTMAVALTENSRKLVRVTHKAQFNPKDIKIEMGLVQDSWIKYRESLEALTKVRVTETGTRKFYEKLFFNPAIPHDEQPLKFRKIVDDLTFKAFYGIGSEMSAGTAWGILNGATELFTHWKDGKRDGSSQFWSSNFGEHDKFKTEIYQGLVAEFL